VQNRAKVNVVTFLFIAEHRHSISVKHMQFCCSASKQLQFAHVKAVHGTLELTRTVSHTQPTFETSVNSCL